MVNTEHRFQEGRLIEKAEDKERAHLPFHRGKRTRYWALGRAQEKRETEKSAATLTYLQNCCGVKLERGKYPH